MAPPVESRPPRGSSATSPAGLRARVSYISLPKPGERENGDAVVVRQQDGDSRTMLAVIDALGHGPGAAEVSLIAIERLARLSVEAPVLDVMQDLHRALRGTRGAAATVCMVSGSRVEGCAVGNVHLLCADCEVPLVLSPGILGHQVARFRVAHAELKPGARLALVSDGISLRFRLEELRHLDVAQTCEFIVRRYRRQEDDATILVAEFKNR